MIKPTELDAIERKQLSNAVSLIFGKIVLEERRRALRANIELEKEKKELCN